MNQKIEKKSQQKQISQKKNQTTYFILFVLILLFLFIKYVFITNKSILFEVGSSHVKFHANWTNKFQTIQSEISSLQKTLLSQTIENVDISFAFSSSIIKTNVKQIMPQKFNQNVKRIKINFESCPISNQGARLVVNTLPSRLESLQLIFNSINSDQNLGKIVGQVLLKQQNLKQLKLSFMSSNLKDNGVNHLLKNLIEIKNIENFETVSLIFMANQLTIKSSQNIKQFLLRLQNVQNLQLNLYSNKFEHQGIQVIVIGLQKLTKLKILDFDLYFNNITEVGTQHVSKAIRKLTNLNTLKINLDFNYIKNEGARFLAESFKQLTQLIELNLGVASKNFGYLGFKDLVKSMQSLVNLKRLTLRCGVNKVGPNGAEVTKQLLKKLNKLEYLQLGFVENYIGDQGVLTITKSIFENLPELKQLVLDFSFNDVKGYGAIESLRQLGKKNYDLLKIILSKNPFTDSQSKLIAKSLQQILKNTKQVKFEFINTQITEKGRKIIQKVFIQHPNSLLINNIASQANNKQNSTSVNSTKDQQL